MSPPANTADVPDRWREQSLYQKLRRRFRKIAEKSKVTYLSIAFLDDHKDEDIGDDAIGAGSDGKSSRSLVTHSVTRTGH